MDCTVRGYPTAPVLAPAFDDKVREQRGALAGERSGTEGAQVNGS